MTDTDGRTPPQDATQVRKASSGWMLRSGNPAFAGQVFPVEGTLTVGRSEDSDISISEGLVSRNHARLQLLGDKLQIEDLNSTNGTFVNDKPVQTADLNPGDVIRFDTVTFTVSGPAPAADEKTQLRPKASEDATQMADPDKTQMAPALKKDATQVVGADAAKSGDTQHAGGWQKRQATKDGTVVIQKAKPSLVGVTPPFDGERYVLTLKGALVGRNSSCDIALNEASVSSRHARIMEKNGVWRVVDQGSSNGTFINGQKVTDSPVEPGDKVRFGRIELDFVLDNGMSAAPSAARKRPGRAKSAKSDALIPTWAYAVIGVIVVAAALAIVLLSGDDDPVGPQIEETSQLSIRKLWDDAGNSAGVPTTPVISDFNSDGVLDVVVADSSGQVTIYDGRDGSKKYSFKTETRIVAPPVVADLTRDGVAEVIIGTADGRIMAFDHTGQKAWESPERVGEVINSPVLKDLNGDGTVDIIVPTAAKGLVAVNGKSGNVLWDSSSLGKGSIITSPVIADINGDGSSDYVSLDSDGHMQAFTVKGGLVRALWKAQTPGVLYASPLFVKDDAGAVVVAATGQGVMAVDATSGKVLWHVMKDAAFFASPVAVDTNKDGSKEIVVVALNGVVSILNRQTGKVINRFKVGADVQASPLLFDATGDGVSDVVVLDSNGRIFIIDPVSMSDKLSGKVAGADSVVASPVAADLDNNKFIELVIVGQNGRVLSYTLNRKAGKGEKVWPGMLGR